MVRGKQPAAGQRSKVYGPAESYEQKLARVMERLEVTKFDWNWDRRECWITFWYKGGFYRFDYSVAKAQASGSKLQHGSDAFAQLVLALEDLARLVQRNIYDLQTWVEGLKSLPPAPEIPACLMLLGFDRIPANVEEIRKRYRELARLAHPDAGGDRERFEALGRLKEQAEEYMLNREEGSH